MGDGSQLSKEHIWLCPQDHKQVENLLYASKEQNGFFEVITGRASSIPFFLGLNSRIQEAITERWLYQP